MAIRAEKRLVTADELLTMPQPDGKTELVRGEIVFMPPTGYDHGVVAGEVFASIHAFCRQGGLGTATTAEAGFVLRRSPDTVRAPDAAFVSAERALRCRGFFPGAPDLAVEVMSPDDALPEVEAKAREYLGAGSRLVWALDPERRVARVYRPDGSCELLTEDGCLLGEDVLPGFELSLAYVFGPADG